MPKPRIQIRCKKRRNLFKLYGIRLLCAENAFVTQPRVSRNFAAQRAEKYRAQLSAYKRAAETVFAKPVTGCALYFLSSRQTIWLDL